MSAIQDGADAVQPADLSVVLPLGGVVVAVGEDRGDVEGPCTAWLRPGTWRASARAMTGRRRALLGMQAQYEHSPPTSSLSTTAAAEAGRAGAVGGVLDGPGPEHHDVVRDGFRFRSWAESGCWCTLGGHTGTCADTPPRGGVVHTASPRGPRPDIRKR